GTRTFRRQPTTRCLTCWSERPAASRPDQGTPPHRTRDQVQRDCTRPQALMDHLSQRGGPASSVVWAHNSHLRDARATEVSDQGEPNVGQLLRERFGNDAVLVSFSTPFRAP